MKDYLSAQGGLTFKNSEMEDMLYVGLAITNKADRARRLGIYTKSQFSHGSGEFFGDADHDVKLIEPTVGFTHGVEIGLAAKLDYHKVIDAEVVLPYTASRAFAGMGAADGTVPAGPSLGKAGRKMGGHGKSVQIGEKYRRLKSELGINLY